MLKVEMNL